MSQLPASAVRTLGTPVAKPGVQRAAASLAPVASARPVASPRPVVAPPPAAAPPAEEPREINIIGPRKLVRPRLPDSVLRNRRVPRRDEPVLWRATMPAASSSQESSHAESFYFQKQVQSQTPMVFVLEDGEKIEGCIEWYDRNAIKVRCTPAGLRGNSGRSGEGGVRSLIYKSSIKYLYKAGENQSQP